MALSRSEVEKLYSPSRWSKRLGPQEVIEEHIRVTTDESERVRRDLPSKKGICFGSGQVDVFGRMGDREPIFVYVSGGYWQQLDGKVSAYPATPMFKEGVNTVVIHYERAPKVTIDQIVNQVLDGVKWTLEFCLERKSSGICMAGHSAGAQLCAMVLCSDWFKSLPNPHRDLFKGVFFISGIFDLEPLINTYVNDVLKMNADVAKQNSPLDPGNMDKIRINLSKTPCLSLYCIVGENDSPAFKKQNDDFAKELIDKTTLSVSRMVIEGLDHFNIVENLIQDDYFITRLIINNLK